MYGYSNKYYKPTVQSCCIRTVDNYRGIAGVYSILDDTLNL
jgi:hypothetical protein